MSQAKPRLSVTLEPATYKAFEELARERRVKMAWLAREILTKIVDTTPPGQPIQLMLAFPQLPAGRIGGNH